MRYSRHFGLPGFTIETQILLKNARILVVGAGGLGCPLLQYLAAAGVGHIGIVDGDVVDASNLQRQILFTPNDIGKKKAKIAARRLRALNPDIEIKVYPYYLEAKNARRLIRQYDIVADGTDNFPTRYLVNDTCVLEGKTNVFAAIFRNEGQLAVFNAPLPDGSRGPNYRHVFPEPPQMDAVMDCSEAGIMGAVAGSFGTMQAVEVLKMITQRDSPLVGKMLIMDVGTHESRVLKLKS